MPMVDLKKLANEIAALSPSEAKELQNITEEYFENGIPLTEEELIKLSHDRLYKNTQGRGIAILTAYKNSASDEDNIKANHRLHFECKLGYYVWKIETYDDVRRANELLREDRKNHHQYILDGIAYLVIGNESKKSITSSTDAFKQDMMGIASKLEIGTIIFKPSTDENAYLIGTSDSTDVGNNQFFDLGKWHPSKFGEMFSILKNGTDAALPEEKKDYAFLSRPSFFSRGNSPY
jgi:hypothetical protein